MIWLNLACLLISAICTVMIFRSWRRAEEARRKADQELLEAALANKQAKANIEAAEAILAELAALRGKRCSPPRA